MYKHLISFLSLLLTGLGTASAASGDTYVKVTQPSDLVIGGTYILAATKSGTTYVATSFNTTDGVLNTATSASGFSVSGNSITVSAALPLEFMLGFVETKGYTLQNGGNRLLGYTNIKTPASVLENISLDDMTDKEIWIFNSVSSQLVSYVNDERHLGYSGSSIKAIVADDGAAYLYRKSSSITLSSACTDGTKYYGTYSSGSAFVVPEDLTVSEIKVVDGKLTMGNYETGAVVPANTGVMVCSSAAGAHSVTLSGEAGSSVFGSENMLRPSGSSITAEAMASADTGCKYYRLTMHNNVTLGFYWGAADGAAFALAANKAYLAVPTGDAARLAGFGMTDGEATGIEAVTGETGNGETYNLLGQRVTADRAKGIVIRNGKKRMVK